MFGADTGMAMGAGIGFFTFIFLLIAGIMAIFIPFWVFRIRNEVIAANQRLEKIVKLLSSKDEVAFKPSAKSTTKPVAPPKLCQECGHQNEPDATFCASCRQRLD